MKKNYTLIIGLLFCSVFTFAQKADSAFTYLNEFESPCEKEFAEYYRISSPVGNIWNVRDYYLSGKLKSQGQFLDEKHSIHDGYFVSYYENGQISSSGKYINKEKDSTWTDFYADGKKDSEGSYINGKMHGKWIFYYRSGVMCSAESYDMDSLIKMKCWNEKGEPSSTCIHSSLPDFPGGQSALIKFLSHYLNYPERARMNGAEGRVVIVFTVDEYGKISQIGAQEGADADFAREGIAAVKLMPNWIPGIEHNKPAATRFSLPIVFKLK